MSIVYWKPIGNKPNEPKQEVYQYGQQFGNANDKKNMMLRVNPFQSSNNESRLTVYETQKVTLFPPFWGISL